MFKEILKTETGALIKAISAKKRKVEIRSWFLKQGPMNYSEATRVHVMLYVLATLGRNG